MTTSDRSSEVSDAQPRPVRRVVIAGGGTAGWMAAAALSHLVATKPEVVLVESDAIGTVGVGEATIPTILTINRLLKIPEPEFLRETRATFKLGIRFENWLRAGDRYIHSFGDTGRGCWAGGFQHFWLRARAEQLAGDYGDYCLELEAANAGKFGIVSGVPLNYAYHLDATRYGQYLRRRAEAAGVRRVEGRIEQVEVNASTGDIDALRLDSGERIAGDLFIDCTGFRALLIEETLQAGYDDWSAWLPCNRALAVQSELEGPPPPFTRSIAHRGGWQWRIPLQHRAGNGLVYNSDACSDDEALRTLLDNVPEKLLTEPRPIRFTTGQRRRYWHRNCVAIGLSSGFIEPLESTSIHMIQNAIMWLLLMFPERGVREVLVQEYNARLRAEADCIRDFIVLHYHLNERHGEPLWDYLRNMPVPDTLRHRMALFAETGRVFKPQDDVFSENSWVQVMLGQGLVPAGYHNIADAMTREQLAAMLQQIRGGVLDGLRRLPAHGQFVEKYRSL
jgi:tryptophan halogenase